MIHAETIEEVRKRLDIVEVIGDFVSLKKAGQNYKAISPFTNEKTPSFFVVPSKELFKDFSSGKGGDVFTFLMEHEGLDYLGAIRYLADKYGIEIKESAASSEDLVKQGNKEGLYVLMDFAKEYYKNNLFHHEEGKAIGLSYFHERGFHDTSIRAFELGYALDGWGQFAKEALDKGHSETLLEEAGLIVKKQGHTAYDRFRKRVLFPIHNIRGKTVAFGARILTQEKNQPKYINSPETAIYHKSQTLYGLFQAKNAIRNNNNCYLVEGYTDVVALHQCGIENTVSSSGTALTVEQVDLIKRFTENITLLFDGDRAGVQAALRGMDLILKEGLNVYVVLFPDGNDPDSYLAQVGSARFQRFLEEERTDFISFKAGLYAKEATEDPIRKAEAIGEMVHAIALIPDPIKQSIYIQKVAGLLKISEAVLLAELNKRINQLQKIAEKGHRVARAQLPVGVPPSLPSDNTDINAMVQHQERETIRLLLNYADEQLDSQKLAHFMWNELEGVVFVNSTYKEIYETFKSSWSTEKPINSSSFFQQGSSEVKKTVADLLTHRYPTSDNWKEKYDIYFPEEGEILNEMAYTNVLRLKLRIVQNMARENRAKIKAAEEKGNDEEVDSRLADQINLDQAKKNLSELLGIVIVQ